jgi:hypothetical protein
MPCCVKFSRTTREFHAWAKKLFAMGKNRIHPRRTRASPPAAALAWAKLRLVSAETVWKGAASGLAPSFGRLNIPQPSLTQAKPGLTSAEPTLTPAAAGLTPSLPCLTPPKPSLSLPVPRLTSPKPGLGSTMHGLTLIMHGLASLVRGLAVAKRRLTSAESGLAHMSKV